jgi:hypothetical protein
MVEHDASTLAHALYGDQTKAITPGIYTIYDNNKNIYKQYNLYEVKDEFNETLFEVREERESIDETLNLDNIRFDLDLDNELWNFIHRKTSFFTN